MKSILTILLVISSLHLVAQNAETSQVYEYSTINLKFNYAGNRIVYQTKSTDLNKYPIISMDGQQSILYNTVKSPDGQITDKSKFTYLYEVLNFMAEYGWRLIQSDMIDNRDKTQGSNETLFNTSQYQQVLIFERPKKDN